MRNLPINPPDSELQTTHSLGGVEHICELHKSCVVLYGIFTEILRSIYHDTDGRLVGTPSVTWSPRKSSLWIDSELRWEDEHPEFRPAIYVQLGQIKYSPYIPGFNGRIRGNDRFGEASYEQKANGTVTFMHVASTSGEACALADNTDHVLTLLQHPICKDFCFIDFSSIGRVPLEKLPKEASDKYASGVIFSYEFAESWQVKSECPILKQIDVLGYGAETTNDYTRRDTINHDNIVTENKGSGLASSK